MSVLEVWRVECLKSGEPKSKFFNWSNFEDLKKFVVEHEVTEVVFNATGLPESQVRPVNTKNVYEVTVPKEEVVNMSRAWVEEQRKRY
jgi:hypothetical protein